MIILHAVWRDETIHLWGEMSPETPYDPPPLRGRRPKVPKTRPFPYDAGLKGLKDALSGFPSGLKVPKKQAGIFSVWLPSKGNAPFPSSPLIDDPPNGRRRTELLPWSVTTRALTFEETRDFLCACRGKEFLARGVLPGADLLWWTEALGFAGTLVTRQGYLPGLTQSGKGCLARWEPVLEGQEEERFNALATGMPPSARCLTETTATVPPMVSARQISHAFVARSVDRLVRSSALMDRRRSARRREKPPKRSGSSAISSNPGKTAVCSSGWKISGIPRIPPPPC